MMILMTSSVNFINISIAYSLFFTVTNEKLRLFLQHNKMFEDILEPCFEHIHDVICEEANYLPSGFTPGGYFRGDEFIDDFPRSCSSDFSVNKLNLNQYIKILMDRLEYVFSVLNVNSILIITEEP